MKKLNFKIAFIFLIFVSLLLIGCKVNKNYVVDNFEYDQSSNTYIQKFQNDTESVNVDNVIVTEDKKAEVTYYQDEEKTIKFSSSTLFLVEGDNYLYVDIEFSDSSVESVVLNFYRLKLFLVKYDTNCATKIEDEYVQEGDLITEPDVELKKNGYAFVGWSYKFNKPISSDLVIEAKWKANSYIVTYDTKGGEIEYGNTIVTYGEPYILDTPIKEGYIFIGWKYNGQIIKSDRWNINSDIIVEAVWEAETKTFEIEYVIVGAVGPNLQRTYTNKETVVLRTPYKNGYKFVGWYWDGQFKSERVYEIPAGTEGNLVLYSKWEKFTLEGSSISFLGDSISTFYSSSSSVNSLYNGANQFYYPIYSATVKTVDQTWWYQVIKETKTVLKVNDSISGSCCYNWGSESSKDAAMNYSRINNLEGSDIVVVFIGTNDNVNGFKKDQFTKAYDTMLKRIKEKCPDSFIFVCTMGYSSYTGYSYKEETRILFNDIIKTLAYNNDCEVIDFSLIQTKDNYSSLLGDMLHPNNQGMTAYATKAIEVIKNYVGA